MKILIANPGSTSYKCKLYDSENMDVLFSASVQRIGDSESIYNYRFGDEPLVERNENIPDYHSAVNLTLLALKQRYQLNEIDAIGFKVTRKRCYRMC